MSNRLKNEKSPYLLQHGDNPVDWYPWGDEAFKKAADENKPVFLSIGYSTCHWCHVMAHESFEDEKVAELLNKNFISIKVDREERPDIDAVYMSVCQALHRRRRMAVDNYHDTGAEAFLCRDLFSERQSLWSAWTDGHTHTGSRFVANPQKGIGIQRGNDH